MHYVICEDILNVINAVGCLHWSSVFNTCSVISLIVNSFKITRKTNQSKFVVKSSYVDVTTVLVYTQQFRGKRFE